MISSFLGLLSVAMVSGETLSSAKITEFLAINAEGLEDEDGNRSDWIELWNSSNDAGNLDGWYLTDDAANLTKWRIPDVELEVGGYLVVFASGKDRTDPANELHANFQLQSSEGGYLALVKPDGVTISSEFAAYPKQFEDISYGVGYGEPAAEVLVEEGDAARVHVPAGPVSGWEEIGFDDSSWMAATTGIGYDSVGGRYEEFFGSGFEALKTAMLLNNASAYIRIPFEVPSPAGLQDLVLGMRWEDGFVAHLNGVEIHRERAPASPVWNSRSDPETGRNEEAAVALDDYALTVGSLVQGTNILAIHGLNQSTGSSDFLISPRLTGMRLDLNGSSMGFFPTTTGGAPNSLLVEGITEDTKFSVDRGLYDTAFDLTISTDTADASIRYTTDGTPPSETVGTLYTGPITIDETTVIRAMAYREGYLSTNVDTHTYLFPADVVTQPEMSTSITQSPVYGPQMVDALESIPTVSLSFDGTNVDRVEVPVSVELLNFESNSKQVDAGVVRYGSYVTNFQKRSIRLHFRSEYGPSRLEYPLFEETNYEIPPTNDFDALDLRAGNHDMIDRGAYLSNRYTDDAMLEMGNLSAHGRFVHLYFNGKYRGQYHLRERWDAAMAADYLPGKEEEYDTINTNNSGSEFGSPGLQQLQDGDLTDWVAMRNLLSGATPYSSVKEMLDVPNLIDFMLLWTMGNSESEFRAAGSLQNGVGFKFFIKDADGYLRPPDGNHSVTHNGPLNALTEFRSEGDPDFQMVLADQIHKRFFNGGALTSERNIARLQHRVDEATLSYIAESARWSVVNGKANRTPSQWLAYQNNLINNQFPNLSDSRLTLLKNANMYPDVIAPVFSQYGGSIAPGSGIVMSTDATTIFYTLDGSDPRLSGGEVSPTALNALFDNGVPTPEDFVNTGAIWKYLDDGSDQGSAWFATDFDDGTWAEGPSQLGYGEGDEAQAIGFIDTDPVAPGAQRNATSYLRHRVDIPNPGSFSRFDLDVLYDDAVAVYVNGVEVARTANLPANAAYDTFATSASPSEVDYERFALSTASFVAGENVIAVELHNERSGSSDVSFDLHLRGEIEAADGVNRTLPVMLSEPGQLNARAYISATGEWSALTSAFFSINSVPASAGNLVISEIHYHPAEPTSAGEIAVSTDRDDYEFIELFNIGLQPVELDGVHFADGITFSFGAESLLDPGARAVVVKDIAAFTARYGGAIEIAGEYSGRLNNGGERLSLELEGVGVLQELTYDNKSPWPIAADQIGTSLVLRSPESGPDHSLAVNWGGHVVVGGAPGGVDAIAESGFADWKSLNGVTSDEEDHDRDGLSALVEYALGTSPNSADHNVVVPGSAEFEGVDYPTIQYSTNVDATDVDFQIQSSTDLKVWVDEVGVEVSPDVYRLTNAIPGNSRQFLRLKITVQ
ncbi:lamin tail domain-containing protein [Akkermansiaceae bacterium]|nr:lamin tail domain-containing protein [Akkermansiaceae bacterium]